MGRHRKPIELARLSGADKKNPQRYRGEVPKADQPFGEYPAIRSTDPAECWREISAQCIPGVLTGADRIILEITSHLLAEYRSDPEGFAVGKYQHLVSCFGRLGMSPSDRTKLGVTKPSDSVYGPL